MTAGASTPSTEDPAAMTAPAVYLASKSPRREELLRQLGIDFASLRLRESSARERDIVEGAHDAEPPRHYVERIARTKATIGWQRMLQRGLPPRPVLGADTEVVLNDRLPAAPRSNTVPTSNKRTSRT